jgi:nitroimidazol reductase NimA-like FMN-containing flavoprotein (pyridoxamine 5'-phosphate oxidase superfamily)
MTGTVADVPSSSCLRRNDMDELERPRSLDEIPRDECWQLLAQFSVGRFAITPPGRSPLVVPVNYVHDGESIVFSSNPGTKLSLVGEPASLEVDCIDPFHHVGWSVLVQGPAMTVEYDLIAHLDLTSWVGERDHWVRLLPHVLTGRRIRLSDIATDRGGYL